MVHSKKIPWSAADEKEILWGERLKEIGDGMA